MKPLHNNKHDPVFAELLARVSPEIANSFNEEQSEAIKKAFGSQSFSRHPLDLRVSVPILGLQFYLVLLAGQERRSKKRLRFEKGVYPLWTIGNIVFLIGFLSVLLSSTLILFPFVSSSLASSLIPISEPYPTSIPWLKNQFECEHTGRTWKGGNCWDYEHNPMF